MARRKSSAAEDLMDLVALLPWWAGVALAAVSYWFLHGIATRPLPKIQPGQPIGDFTTTALWQGLATGGQYLLPLICLFGAALSVIKRRQRRQLYETASAGDSAEVLQGMSWQEFELLVGEGFRRRGYGVRESGGGGADGGVDLVLTKDGEKIFVQCKQWKAFKVGVSTVRELYGVMAAHGATGGFVVTSGRFTKEATDFAQGRNIQLLDGSALMQLLREARGTGRRDKSSEVRHATQDAEPIATAILCPKCGKPMVRRMAKRGATVGKPFWGCSNFSGGCRGTREI